MTMWRLIQNYVGSFFKGRRLQYENVVAHIELCWLTIGDVVACIVGHTSASSTNSASSANS